MVMPISILVLAWGVAFVCDTEQLITGGFNQAVSGNIATNGCRPLPCTGRGLFATGTSARWRFSFPRDASGILMHVDRRSRHRSRTRQSAGRGTGHDWSRPGGRVFGDHCSPISIRPSYRRRPCDHLARSTQLPCVKRRRDFTRVLLPVGWDQSCGPWRERLRSAGCIVKRKCESEIA
jgi:hypothetical protein